MEWEERTSPSGEHAPADSAWRPATVRPPPYTIALLSFEDGSVRRGVWNGKIWWGYDERVRRACELNPLQWRIWTETTPTITTIFPQNRRDPGRS